MAEVRLIDAIAMATEFEDLANSGLIWEEMCAFNEAAKMVQKAPTIDPESLRPKGRKERSAISETGLMCTNCYSDVDMDAVFCKYCGAKMEG